MGSFSLNFFGFLAVTYTITGPAGVDSAPFSIGIYQSSDGLHTDNLAGTIDVTGNDGVAGDGLSPGTHTLWYIGSLNGLDCGQYYIAKLDCYNELVPTRRNDLVSAPLTGVFRDSDGSLYVILNNGNVRISQDAGTGGVMVNGGATAYENVSEIYVVTYSGNNTIDAAGVNVPMEIYGGSGSDTIYGGDGGNTIYGGTAGGNRSRRLWRRHDLRRRRRGKRR